jgi:hypothetical protein
MIVIDEMLIRRSNDHCCDGDWKLKDSPLFLSLTSLPRDLGSQIAVDAQRVWKPPITGAYDCRE